MDGAISTADSPDGMVIRGYEHWFVNNGAFDFACAQAHAPLRITERGAPGSGNGERRRTHKSWVVGVVLVCAAACADTDRHHGFVHEPDGDSFGVTYTLQRVFEVAGRQGIATDGARIVLGMPKDFYPGYDREVHEVYVYSMTNEK
jgi:hypothetical protein